jgi:adenylate cyclase
MDIAAYQAAGLYDPDAPDAADRLALLEHLDAHGVPIELMIRSDAIGSLHAAATDARIRPGAVISVERVAELAGISVELVRAVLLAAGVRLDDDDYRDADVELFMLFAGGAVIFGEEPMLQLTRAIGSSMARVADAALALFLVNIERPLREEGAGNLPLAEAAGEATDSLEVLPLVMGGFFRLHFQAATRRQRMGSRASLTPGLVQLAIGFVDLVGFTPYARDLEPDELAEFVEEFERRSNNIVAAHGGRIVKHIGDEVMFVDVDPVNACEIAWHLVKAFGGEAGVSPHAGVGFGPVIARGGDYYGSVVNLASRIAAVAVPGEILVTDELIQGATATETSIEFEPAGRRSLKGFAEPIPLWSVTRSRPAP